MSDRLNRYLRDIPLPGLEDGPTGYRGPQVCKIVGISYRQLDYWTTTRLVSPSVRDAEGSGSQRLYSFEDIVQLRIIKQLLDTGISLQKIRSAMQYVRDRGYDLRHITLMSDGKQVYALDDQREMFDILKRGQGVFAIAVDPLYAELEAEVTRFPAERAQPPVARGTRTESGGEDPSGQQRAASAD